MATYRYLFGDGTTAGPTAELSLPHTYEEGGTYTVHVDQLDDAGAVTASAETTVTAKPPALDFHLVGQQTHFYG